MSPRSVHRLPLLGTIGDVDAPKERADAQRNRTRILSAARAIMRGGSLDALCMDEVAVRAGVGKGTLYRRFADKSSLLRALLDDDERALQEEVRRRFGRKGTDPAVALTALLHLLFEFVLEHAEILEAAEASERSSMRDAHPAYVWRHTLLAQHIERARVARGDAAAQLADMLMAAMGARVVVRARARASDRLVRAEAHAFFAAAVQRTTTAVS